MPDLTAWATIKELTSQEILEFIDYLKSNPISARDDAEIQQFADSSGIPPQEYADTLNQALILQLEVAIWQKTNRGEITYE